MKPTATMHRVYDLAAMRGWRTIRLDRAVAPKAPKSKRFTMPPHELPKAA